MDAPQSHWFHLNSLSELNALGWIPGTLTRLPVVGMYFLLYNTVQAHSHRKERKVCQMPVCTSLF